eukprot:COSAG01_NODE_1320_length_10740_cov_34.039094_2_plen_1697_part_00
MRQQVPHHRALLLAAAAAATSSAVLPTAEAACECIVGSHSARVPSCTHADLTPSNGSASLCTLSNNGTFSDSIVLDNRCYCQILDLSAVRYLDGDFEAFSVYLEAIKFTSLEHIGGTAAIVRADYVTTIEAPSLRQTRGGIQIERNEDLSSVRLPALELVGTHPEISVEISATDKRGGALVVAANPLLRVLDLRRLAGVAGSVSIDSNHDQITTTLQCAVHGTKMVPAGRTLFINPTPTSCYYFSSAVGTTTSSEGQYLGCHECAEQPLDTCGGAGKCVACGNSTAVLPSFYRFAGLETPPRQPYWLNWNVSSLQSGFAAPVPTLQPGFVGFHDPSSGGRHVYPQAGVALSRSYPMPTVIRSMPSPPPACICPANQTICNVQTDLLDAEGRAGTRQCLPNSRGALRADVYIYANAVVQHVDFGRVNETASITIVACDRLSTINATFLQVVKGILQLSDLGILGQLQLPALQEVGDLVSIEALSSVATISLPALQHVQGFFVDEVPTLTTLSCPQLESLKTMGLQIQGASFLKRTDFSSLSTLSKQGQFSISDVNASHETTFPCSVQDKTWASQVTGTTMFVLPTAVVCYSDGSALSLDTCGECDKCVDCSSGLLVADGYVPFVGDNSDREEILIVKCTSKTGCYGSTSTLKKGDISCQAKFEGHFCQSCEPGYFLKEIGGGKYDCAQCEAHSVALSLGIAGTVAVLVAALLCILWKKQKLLSSTEVLAFQAVLRATIQPFRIMITYSQISSQLSTVLSVSFPTMFTEIMDHFGEILRVLNIFVSPGCVGMSGFWATWLKEVVIQPLAMQMLVFVYYMYERRSAGSKTAHDHAIGNSFFVLFFCYPAVCNTAFSAFICDDVDGSTSVLVADDRVLCEDDGHEVLQVASLIVIAIVGFGVPFIALVVLWKVNRERRSRQVDHLLLSKLGEELCIGNLSAKNFVADLKLGSKYGFLTDAYKSQYYMWESVDMFRKLSLVGVVLLFERGTPGQSIVALVIVMVFILSQVSFAPYRMQLDNLLRVSTELHILISILIAILVKTDLLIDPDREQRDEYGYILLATLAGLVAVPFVAVLWAKLSAVHKVMQKSLDETGAGANICGKLLNKLESLTGIDLDGDGDVGIIQSKQSGESSTAAATGLAAVRMAFRRFELGLHSGEDKQLLLDYVEELPTESEHVRAGRKIWKGKTLVAHLNGEEMANILADMEQKLPKQFSLCYHFTTLTNARRALLQSSGLRASSAGQLGGGVSVSVSSHVEMGWQQYQEGQFKENVGHALWGDKYREVMTGGPYAEKLETLLVFRLPTVKDQSRFLPGRDSVYIIPDTQLTPADEDGFRYYSSTNLEHLFVLKPPSPDRDSLVRLAQQSMGDAAVQAVITLDPDDEAAMSVEVCPDNIDDEVDDETLFVRKTLVWVPRPCTSAGVNYLALLREREQHHAAKAMWVESVSRFTRDEMRAAMYSIDQKLSRGETLVYCFLTEEAAEVVAKAGGGLSTAADGALIVCRQSPVDLGWEKNAKGAFKRLAAEAQFPGERWQEHRDDIKVMAVMGVPTASLDRAHNHEHQGRPHTVRLPNELLSRCAVDGTSDFVYSNAHIQKLYKLDPANASTLAPSDAASKAAPTHPVAKHADSTQSDTPRSATPRATTPSRARVRVVASSSTLRPQHGGQEANTSPPRIDTRSDTPPPVRPLTPPGVSPTRVANARP